MFAVVNRVPLACRPAPDSVRTESVALEALSPSDRVIWIKFHEATLCSSTEDAMVASRWCEDARRVESVAAALGSTQRAGAEETIVAAKSTQFRHLPSDGGSGSLDGSHVGRPLGAPWLDALRRSRDLFWN